MNKQEKLDCLKEYIKSFDRLPDQAMNQGVSYYELKTILEMLYDLLVDNQSDPPTVE